MDHCDVCGFTYATVGAAAVPSAIRSLASRYATRLLAEDERIDDLTRMRPRPDVWSALEYACHLRDVVLVQRERLYLALVEDCPSFKPMYREQRTVLGHHNQQDRARVAAEIGLATSLLASDFGSLDEEQWMRRCIYNYPEPAEVTLLWLGQHTVHEGEHHLRDIDAGLAAVRSG
jgi:S-DNA-T family DNA segregation ATPase FtsK/SpoIIIE